MKRLFLTLVMSLALCGLSFAQHETHWSEFNYHDYSSNLATVAYIQIDNQYITPSDNWADMEVAVFVGTVCRGHNFMVDETSEGDLYPIINIPVYYTNEGEDVTFKLFDHGTGIEYDDCTCNMVIHTGEIHDELYFNPENAVVLSFTSPVTSTFNKEIVGYGDNPGGYYLIAAPVDGVSPASITGMTEGVYDLYSFDQTQDLEWKNYKSAAFDMVSGMGYLYAHKTDVTLTFSGTPVEGTTFDVSLVKDDDAAFAGWNLVGNPFTVPAYIGRDFYVLNSTGSEVITATNNSIASMEGVFVVATEDGETLTFTTETSGSKGSWLALNLSQDRGVIDRAIVRFGEGSQLPKYQINENSSKVFIRNNNTDYAVVRSEGRGEVPVSFRAEKNGNYTLSFSSENVEFGYLHLIDNLTGADIDLIETPSYSFEANLADYPSRFKLVYSADVIENDDFAYLSNGNIIISGMDSNATLQVIDLTGRIVLHKDGVHTVSTNGMASGVYWLRLINGEIVKTQKIVIK